MTLSRPKLLQGLVKAGIGLQNLSLLPANSGLRLKLGLLEQGIIVRQEPAPPARHSTAGEQTVSYFTGCLARYLQPSVAEATKRLYRDLGGNSLQVPATQVCCGLAAWSAGSINEARNLARKNIAAFGETKGPILASCASCSSFLSSYPDLFADDPAWHARAVSFCARVREFSSFFLQSSKGRTFKAGKQTRIYYHEPCHLRFDRKNREATYRLIDRISGLVRLDTPEGQHCCGQGGLFHIGYPELAEEIFSRACVALNAAEPALVITTCSGCLLQWQAETAIRSMPVKARHLAVFLADCLAESG